jgi:hypothetical protein
MFHDINIVQYVNTVYLNATREPLGGKLYAQMPKSVGT